MSDRRCSAVVALLCIALSACASNLPLRKPNFALDKYIVRPGDTVESVAYRYRQDPDALRAANGLSADSALVPGSRLVTGKAVYRRMAQQSPQRHVAQQARTAVSSVAPQTVVVPAAMRRQPVPETVVVPASARVADNEEIIETVRFDPPVAKPAVRKPVASASGWIWPTSGDVARGYQANVVNRQGVDITAKRGEAVLAAADGKVVYSGQDLASHGKLVILKHKNNVLSAYSYAQELYVKEDELVKAGDAIASVGDGEERSSILHFEIRKNGNPVDPLTYLPKR